MVSEYNWTLKCLKSDPDCLGDIDAFAADSATAQTMLHEIAYFSQLLDMTVNTAKIEIMGLNIQLRLNIL